MAPASEPYPATRMSAFQLLRRATAALPACLAVSGSLWLLPGQALAQAQGSPGFRVIGTNVQKHANGVLTLMSYSVVPDLASSSLSINNAATDNPGVFMWQLGGGFTISKSFPLYLEGALAYSRYDPTFIASDGTQSRALPVRWNTFSGTIGIGWDFPLTENKELVFRPIFTPRSAMSPAT